MKSYIKLLSTALLVAGATQVNAATELRPHELRAMTTAAGGYKPLTREQGWEIGIDSALELADYNSRLRATFEAMKAASSDTSHPNNATAKEVLGKSSELVSHFAEIEKEEIAAEFTIVSDFFAGHTFLGITDPVPAALTLALDSFPALQAFVDSGTNDHYVGSFGTSLADISQKSSIVLTIAAKMHSDSSDFDTTYNALGTNPLKANFKAMLKGVLEANSHANAKPENVYKLFSDLLIAEYTAIDANRSGKGGYVSKPLTPNEIAELSRKEVISTLLASYIKP